MKRNNLWILVVLLALAIGTVVVIQIRNHRSTKQSGRLVNEAVTQTRRPLPTTPNNANAHQVPAHYEVPPSSLDLRPVLAASQFVGKTREAYEVVQQISAMIAQMPCYCHCDRGMGHKSLHSCFEDDHAAHCVTCVDEALLAYRLQKQGLSAEKIREQIIAEFGD